MGDMLWMGECVCAYGDEHAAGPLIDFVDINTCVHVCACAVSGINKHQHLPAVSGICGQNQRAADTHLRQARS